MKKYLFILCCLVAVIACNNSNSDKPQTDTTGNLSQTNNSVDILVDTLGFHTDSASKKYEKGSTLITQSDCLNCHKVKEQSIGPSYVAIAEKYLPTPENIQHLASTITNGSKGVWGQVPMAPHPTISKEDATEMVYYILALKGVK
jgi:cytochrome c